MKNTYKFLGLIAAASAMSLVSCQKQEFQPDPEGTTITVNATVEDPIVTKTYVEELEDAFAIKWSDNELNMQAFVWNESKFDEAVSNEFTSNSDGTGTFNVTVPSSEWTNIAGIYPSTAVNKANGDSQTRMRTALPTTQSPSATSYDPAAYILIAKPSALPTSLEGFTWEAYYYRATALNKFMVTNLENNGNIVSVKITFPEGEKVSGYKRVNLTTAEVIEYNAQNPNYVELNYKSAPLAANGEGTYDLWFTTWTVNVPMESTGFTVEVTTEEYKYTKTFIPKKEGFILEENTINLVPVDMTGADVETIVPAEDLSGEYLIIAQESSNWVYMGASSGSYHAAITSSTPISKVFNALTSADFIGAEEYVWTVSKIDGGYTVKNSQDLYLDLPSSNGTSLSSDEQTLTIEQQDDGTCWISSSAASRHLQYNSGSPRFANYQDSFKQGKPIYLLPWVESTEPVLIVSETSKTVDATAESVTFEYIARNLTGKVTADEGSDPDDIISSISVNEEASTVTVELIENLDENEKTATVILSADGVDPVTLTIKKNGVIVIPSEGTETIKMSDVLNNGERLTNGQTYDWGYLSILFEQKNNSNSYYDGSVLRWYKNDNLTFSIAGRTITKLEFKATQGSISANVGVVNGYVWTGESSSVTLTADDQVRFSEITVTYK